jgi:hypothetical protein
VLLVPAVGVPPRRSTPMCARAEHGDGEDEARRYRATPPWTGRNEYGSCESMRKNPSENGGPPVSEQRGFPRSRAVWAGFLSRRADRAVRSRPTRADPQEKRRCRCEDTRREHIYRWRSGGSGIAQRRQESKPRGAQSGTACRPGRGGHGGGYDVGRDHLLRRSAFAAADTAGARVTDRIRCSSACGAAETACAGRALDGGT